MRKLGEILPILLASGILLAGNGLQGTLIAVRANLEGFDASVIGLIGTTYFLGFMFGCRYAPHLIANVGHIRAFAAFAAIGASGALMLALIVNPVIWMVIRCAMGIVFAGLSMVMESWLNERASSADRGRVLGLYRTVDLCAVTGAQFLLPVFGAQGFTLFAIVGIFFCMALVPVSLTRGPSPRPPEHHDFNLKWIWAISPLAVAGCLTIGLTTSAFRIVGPLYAAEIGLDVGQLAIFMSAGIVGGALMPLPLGWLSDRFSRRWLVVIATLGAAFAGLFLSFMPASDPNMIYLGSFLFGAFAMPLYSLSIAHANDLVKPSEFVNSSAALLFVFGAGATIGPFVAAVVLDWFGPPAIFTYTTVMHTAFVVFVFYRMARRPNLPSLRKSVFTAFMRTSPAIFRLARKNGGSDSR